MNWQTTSQNYANINNLNIMGQTGVVGQKATPQVKQQIGQLPRSTDHQDNSTL